MAKGITRVERAAAAWTWVILAFMNVPILIIVVLSFSPDRYLSFPPSGVSVRWYERYFTSARWIDATATSLKVAIWTVALATPLGVMASFALVRGRFPGRRLLSTLFMTPMIVPSIAAAVALYFAFSRLGLTATIPGMVLGHTALAVPMVVVTLTAALSNFDIDLESAARGLGANRWNTFWWITRPLVQPSILTGALFAFLVSFDELAVSLFLAGVDAQTLPVRMWISMRDELDPTIAAVSTLLIALSALVILGVNLLRWTGSGIAPSVPHAATETATR